jgi:DNA-binding IclR family transcriptional regulator
MSERSFIDPYTRVHGRPPAETYMQRHFGVSPPSVHQMILTLERAGLMRPDNENRCPG